MEREQPRVVILAGPNGAGKTTSSFELLKGAYAIDEFINADAIAKGLSAFAPESVALEAGRIMLTRIGDLVSKKQSFATETTLASRSLAGMVREWRQRHGYQVILFYLWLPSADMAVERVADRVRAGGHNIPEEVIRRRYERGVVNLLSTYKDIVDEWYLIDSSGTGSLRIIAEGTMLNEELIHDFETWQALNSGI